MDKNNNKMSELSDQELLDMVGGFVSDYSVSKFNPPIRMYYGVGPKPLYGIQPPDIVRPLYGIEPPDVIRPLYGIVPPSEII